MATTLLHGLEIQVEGLGVSDDPIGFCSNAKAARAPRPFRRPGTRARSLVLGWGFLKLELSDGADNTGPARVIGCEMDTPNAKCLGGAYTSLGRAALAASP
jgi:hypothetical protein